MGISIPQLMIILLIVALLFGTKKLRNIGGDLGSALKGFKNAMTDSKENEPESNKSTEDVSQEANVSQGTIVEGEVQKSEHPAEQKEERA